MPNEFTFLRKTIKPFVNRKLTVEDVNRLSTSLNTALIEHGLSLIHISTIYCERDSQKGIIIGKKGALLKQLGAEARADIQKLLATKVYLDLWVKVKKDWRNKSGMLSELGYRK